MWIMVMFDLPTDSSLARRRYREFREKLLKRGFTMLQFSVYARHCASQEKTDVIVKAILGSLPPEGEVRIIRFTDKQFERMQVFLGKSNKPTEHAPEQISFL